MKTPLMALVLRALRGDEAALNDEPRARVARRRAERSAMDRADPIAERSPYHPAFLSPWRKPLH